MRKWPSKYKKKCKILIKKAPAKKLDELTRDILDIWRLTARKKTSVSKDTHIKQEWWNDEIESLYNRKQELVEEIKLAEGDQKAVLIAQRRKLAGEMDAEISVAMNESFKQFATNLNHRTGTDVYKYIRNATKPQSPKITSVAVIDQNGNPVTSSADKVEALSKQYLHPLGEKPVYNEERINEIRQLKQSKKQDLTRKVWKEVTLKEEKLQENK